SAESKVLSAELTTQHSALPTPPTPHFEHHTQTSLSTMALMSREQQSMSMQLLIAEGEQAISHAKWDGAIDTCMAVIDMDPTYLPVHMMLGDIYVAQSKQDEAATKFQTVMETYSARK